MSRVYFHSPSGEAELLGIERHYANALCVDLALLVLKHEINPFRGESPLLAWVPADSYLRTVKKEAFPEAFEAWFWSGFGTKYLVDPRTGAEYPPFRLGLNTAMAAGSDPVRLLARIHGSCEIHGYVEGPDREWLAGIMETGLRDNVFRPDRGWESLIELLRGRDDDPVVMSYSVTEGSSGIVTSPASTQMLAFGNPEERDEWWDAWDEQPADDQWTQALEALRLLNETWFLRLDPSLFAEHRFGGGESAFDIARLIHEKETTPC